MRVAIAVVMLAAMTVSCDAETDCEPTRMTAAAAEKVDLAQPGESSVLTARLTTGDGDPLPGLPIVVEVLDDGAEVYTDEATTDDGGDVRVELVGEVDIDAVQGIARGDAWRARFDGNAEYCSSDDRAAFNTLNGP